MLKRIWNSLPELTFSSVLNLFCDSYGKVYHICRKFRIGWSSPCACQTLFLTAYPAGHFFVTFSEIRRKASFLFVIIPIFRNFGRICRFSLYKGSLEDWEFWRLRIRDRSNLLVLLWIAFNEHPMTSHQPFLWLIFGSKGNNYFWNSQTISTICALYG